MSKGEMKGKGTTEKQIAETLNEAATGIPSPNVVAESFCPQNRPMVSVCMITYNHEQYIAQAIDSVLMQQTTFSYDFIIGEDCSTDNTRAIVLQYQQKYSGKIRLLLPEKNLGAHENLHRTLAACGARYIAFLEGDDYWVDPMKLQQQVDFMESHLECSLCFHNVYELHQGHGHFVPQYNSPMKKFYSLEDIAVWNFIHASSVMFRSTVLTDLSAPWIRELGMCDWPWWVLCAQKGSLGYIDSIMSVYRKHPGGIWSSQPKVNAIDGTLRASYAIQKRIGIRSHAMAAYRAELRREAIGLLRDQKQYRQAARHALMVMAFSTRSYLHDVAGLMRVVLRGCCPGGWRVLAAAKHKLTGHVR